MTYDDLNKVLDECKRDSEISKTLISLCEVISKENQELRRVAQESKMITDAACDAVEMMHNGGIEIRVDKGYGDIQSRARKAAENALHDLCDLGWDYDYDQSLNDLTIIIARHFAEGEE